MNTKKTISSDTFKIVEKIEKKILIEKNEKTKKDVQTNLILCEKINTLIGSCKNCGHYLTIKQMLWCTKCGMRDPLYR